MEQKILVKKSKWLSKHLRHAPEKIGLTLEDGGWVSVTQLLEAARRTQFALSRAELEEVVVKNDKQRFGFDASGEKIRAHQGHSAAVQLNFAPQTPPPVLYHGTSERNQEIILNQGLQKMRRHHIHLSSDVATATRVGARHGKPIIFEVDAARMSAEGVEFFHTENDVWLTDFIAPQYLKKL